MPISAVTLPPYSMFKSTPLYAMADGTVAPGVLRNVVGPDSSDAIYVVTQGTANRLEAIAGLFYDVQEVWWVLAQINRILDPWADVPQGTRLRVPTRQRLLAAKILST